MIVEKVIFPGKTNFPLSDLYPPQSGFNSTGLHFFEAAKSVMDKLGPNPDSTKLTAALASMDLPHEIELKAQRDARLTISTYNARRLWNGNVVTSDALVLMPLQCPLRRRALVVYATIKPPEDDSQADYEHENDHLCLYPLPQHVRLFGESSLSLKDTGPSEKFPGAVGVVQFSISGKPSESSVGEIAQNPALALDPIYLLNENARYIRIGYVQGCFKQGKPATLTRAIVTKYGGWREHLLTCLFGRAVEQGINFIVMNVTLYGLINERNNSVEIFKSIAKKQGWEVMDAGPDFMGKPRFEIAYRLE